MASAHDGHASGALTYVGIWVALLVLTAVTYVTGRMHFPPPWAIVLAMGIAATKAMLVVVFFMHLKDHGATNRAYFVTSLLFVGLLTGLVVSDVATRLPSARPIDLEAQVQPPALPGVGNAGAYDTPGP